MGKSGKMKRALDTLDDVWAINITISGKRFVLHETFTNKSAALNRAKKKRKEGYLARVKKVKNMFNRSYIPFTFLYRVYIRRK